MQNYVTKCSTYNVLYINVCRKEMKREEKYCELIATPKSSPKSKKISRLFFRYIGTTRSHSAVKKSLHAETGQVNIYIYHGCIKSKSGCQPEILEGKWPQPLLARPEGPKRAEALGKKIFDF